MIAAQLRRRFLPSHAILRSFECAARHQSFTLAAKELHLTQSAISRQVKELEQIVGTEMFRRVGRRVVLTEAGRNLASELAVDLESIRQTVLRAIASGDHGTSLRIAVLPTFASRWLIPRLPDFAKHHPEFTVNITTRLEPFELAKDNFDIAIHFGTEDWPDTKMVRIFEEEMIPVCAPEFQIRYDISATEQLEKLPLLHLETRPTAWSEWFQKIGIDSKVSYSGMHFDQFSMLISGALASLGAALIPKYLIESELESGKLVRQGKMSLRTNNGYYLVTSIGSNRPGVKEFSNWIGSETRPNQPTKV
ncbi:MAG: LysR family transcriptional regulator [Paracoccaceae bacterium]